MISTLNSEAQRIAVEVHEYLLSVDPSRSKREFESKMRERAVILSARIDALLRETREERGSAVSTRLRESLLGLSERLQEIRRRAPEAGDRFQLECKQVRERLQPAYAALVEALRIHALPAPNYRPTNLLRTVSHVCSGLAAFAMLQKVLVTESLYHWIPLLPPLLFWTLEISRRKSEVVNDVLMKLLGKIAHAHEWERINSGTWYGTSLAILVWTVDPFSASVAVLVLGVADPAASLVGRRYGSISIAKGKSLEGTLAFWLLATLASVTVFFAVGPLVPLWKVFAIAVGAGAITALAEAYVQFVDDNFSVPLVSGWSTALLCMLLGVSL